MAPVETVAIDRTRLKNLIAQEEQRFIETHPRSLELFTRAKRHLLAGVPMNWMIKWASPFPLYVEQAAGSHFTDVDGHDYVDLCLGDTGAMTGHSPPAAVEPIIDQLRRGI